ncbi:MAG TPA: glycosyltransferase 87 family protein [Anaerolineales bacterium]|nr:glycosyltransferase 87 family protein [Anaerolineales bacterium]
MRTSKEFKQRLTFALLFSFGLLLRVLFIPAKTLDMGSYILWYDYIVKNGLGAIGSNYFGYNPPFIYLLALTTLTHSFLHPVIAIKLIPFIFDILSAILVYHIVRMQEHEEKKPLLAALIFWIAPTIMINSSFWGQTDAIYTFFLLFTTFFLLKERPIFALLAFGIAFSIKAQAIFFAPFLGVLFFKKKIPFKAFLTFPVVYAISFIPAIIAGRPIATLFSTYGGQTETFASASKNAANPYFFVNEQDYLTILYIGLVIAVTLLVTWVLIYSFKKYEITKPNLIITALNSLAIVPYLLPKMHDRYFYPADVFSIICAFFLPRFWPVAIAYQAISFLSYLPYLFNTPAEATVSIAFVINTITIIFLIQKQWAITNET